jgi:diacylglycerol kinase (ATP)
MKSAFAIVNPVAGRGAATRAWKHLSTHVEWESATTEGPGHARTLAEAAVHEGYERVIAVGGDGTLSEVANGVAGSATALGIIPAGTGNDIATNFGIPRDPRKAAQLAERGPAEPIDLCTVETQQSSRYFMNVAGFGFDAEVAWRVNRLPKFGGGTLPYLAGVLQTLWQYRSPRMRIQIDGQLLDQKTFLVAVGNCPSYGGGMRIVPEARPDDGLVDVCVVTDLSRAQVLRLLPSLYSGGHVRHPAVKMFRCHSVTVDADVRVQCQADGELVGDLPARFGIHPGALRCVTGPFAGSSS